MKFQLGGLQISFDMNQALQGHGVTINVNGSITNELKLEVEFQYLPNSTERVNVEIKVYNTNESNKKHA